MAHLRTSARGLFFRAMAEERIATSVMQPRYPDRQPAAA